MNVRVILFAAMTLVLSGCDSNDSDDPAPVPTTAFEATVEEMMLDQSDTSEPSAIQSAAMDGASHEDEARFNRFL